MKPFIRTLFGSGVSIIREYYLQNSLTIFCFHDISINPSEFSRLFDLNIPPHIFINQINFINNNFNVISPDDLLESRIPENAALITFDDGFKSYFTTALPILKRSNTPSLIFLNMAPIKGEIFWSGLITYLCNKSADFQRYMTSVRKLDLKIKPSYLFCSRELVDSFINFEGTSFRKEVHEFVGDFAEENDLDSVSSSPLVYFGNHLFNHDIPLLLTDNELLDSFYKNELELKKTPNYRNLFAFPFGTPIVHFSKSQLDLLLNNHAKLIFSSYPLFNPDVSARFLHRIPLFPFNNTKYRILFSIFKIRFYELVYIRKSIKLSD